MRSSARFLVSTCLLSAVLLSGRAAHADGDPTTDTVPRVIPYQGVLEIDGGAYNGEVPMTFSLYRAATGGSAVWTESQDVVVFNGVFGVTLGAAAAIDATIFAADTLYLGVTIDGVEMANRQAITPVPYALWSARSADFTVARDLTVARDARVARDLTVARDARVGEDLAVIGSTSVAGLTVAGALSLPSGSVTGAMVADGSIASADIADGSIASADIADGSIASADIAEGTVESADIADNTVTLADLNGEETAVYAITNDYCPDEGYLTLNRTCIRSTELCVTGGGSPAGFVRNCSNNCVFPSVDVIICSNTLVGYLFAP